MPKKYATFNADGVRSAQLIEGVNDITDSAVPISEELYLQMTQETDGQWVINAEGVISKVPFPADPVVPLTREQVEAQRLRAYAEPLNGSDRYFAEARRMQIMGEQGGEAVCAAGVARYEAIQALYPWAPPEAAEL
ncbi:HAD family hydrolase [Pseudomonas sp. IT-P171]|uniref:hypothetical protein n=1 Tax=Pseudomonas sp. IT-P171 TaxID=3026453 RepID=UPI0039DF7FAA